MQIANFASHVASLAAQHNGKPFVVSSSEQACCVVEKLFASAKESVSILSPNLDALVFGSRHAVSFAERFAVDPNRKIKILVEQSDPDLYLHHPLVSGLKDSRNFLFKAVPPDQQARYNFSFMVVDSKSFFFQASRLSYSEAIGSFGNSQNASHLSEMFEVIWTHSVPIDLRELVDH